MEDHKIKEEVTVTPLIRDIERLVSKGFRGITRLIYLVLEGIVEFFSLAFNYLWVLVLALIVGGGLGFFSSKIIPRQYASSMILKLNVDAKDQLLNDIHFFNALVGQGEHGQLSELFAISKQEAQAISGFEVYAYSDFIEKTFAMQDIYGSIDTALFNALDLEMLINQNESALSSRFKIIVTANQQDVFANIEGPLLAYLERVPELNGLLLAGRKSLEFQRAVYVREMDNIDTLSKVLNQVMLTQASQPQGSGDMNVNMGTDDLGSNDISAIDLQDRYIFYAGRIAKIDNELEKHKNCYFVNSHLNAYGEKIGYGSLTRGLIGAFLMFALVYLFVGFRFWGEKAA